MDEEGLQDTPNKLIHIGKPIDFDTKLFEQQVGELYEAAYRDAAEIRVMVKQIVKTYHPKE